MPMIGQLALSLTAQGGLLPRLRRNLRLSGRTSGNWRPSADCLHLMLVPTVGRTEWSRLRLCHVISMRCRLLRLALPLVSGFERVLRVSRS